MAPKSGGHARRKIVGHSVGARHQVLGLADYIFHLHSLIWGGRAGSNPPSSAEGRAKRQKWGDCY
jgi:hypothetical protein